MPSYGYSPLKAGRKKEKGRGRFKAFSLSRILFSHLTVMENDFLLIPLKHLNIVILFSSMIEIRIKEESLWVEERS